MTMATPTHELMDLLASPASAKLPASWHRMAADALRNEQIERFEYPSPTPGVSGGRKGASPKQLEVQRVFFERKHRVMALAGGNQCLAENELVATPSGPVMIQYLRPGDDVYGPDGKPIKVLAVYNNGPKPCVTLTNRGVPLATCTRDHVFLTSRFGRTTRQAAVGTFQRDTRIARVEVDCPLGLIREEHAYAIGALLGDGCSREAGRLLYMSSATPDVPNAVAACLGGVATKTRSENYTYSLGVRECNHYDDWMRGRYAHEKTTSIETLRTWDRESLLAFVAGLLDTDGSVYVDGFGALTIRIEMQAEMPVVALQYAMIALWQTRAQRAVSNRPKYVNGPCHVLKVANNAYTVRMLRELAPYMRSHKRWKPEYEAFRAKRTNAAWIGAKISDAGVRNTYDIHVDHPDNLYLLANGLVTHNSGKTECAGGLCFCKWVRDRAQEGDVYWIVAQRTEDLRNVPAKTLWQFLPRSMFPAGLEYHPRHGFGQIPTLALTLPGGRGTAEVWFRSEEMELNVFESARTNGVWWTECSRESIFDALQPRLAARGGFLLMDYVPREAWHRLRIQTNANPYIYFTRFSMSDNAHNLAAGEIDYQRSVLTPEEAAVRIDGKDGAAFGVVFKEFSLERNVIKPMPVPLDWPAWVYIDVGKYTAALLCTVDRAGGRLVIADEYYSLGQTVEENANGIKAMLGRHGRTPEQVAEYRMDPAAWAFTAANQATVGEQYQKQGLSVSGWTKTASVGESAMLDRMRQAFLHGRLVVSESCPKLIMELQTWRHKTDRDGKVDPNDRYEGPNHAIDAAKAWTWTDPTFEQAALTILDAPEQF